MRGIEMARSWFFSAVQPVLERDFADILPRIAIGIAGRGSECFGFDDEISHDHDFKVGVSMWLSEEDDLEYGVHLQRAYNNLCRELPGKFEESRLGYAERGVCAIPDFFRRHIGVPGVPQCWQEWFYTPEYAFAEVVNGEIFRDDSGVFSGIRDDIRQSVPTDVRLKKLAGYAVLAAQSGQYNFSRCLKHGEPGAANLALNEFVRHAGMMLFWLKHRFAPYYKWFFRAMKQLPGNGNIPEQLETLLITNAGNDEKLVMIENICSWFVSELKKEGLTGAAGNYLETHAFEIIKHINSREIRALHIMDV